MAYTSRSKAIQDISGLSNEDLMKISAYCLDRPITDPAQMPEPVLQGYGSDTGYRYRGAGSLNCELFQLADKLLSFGGDSVCLPEVEEDLKNILTYGQLWYGKKVRMKKGRPNRCHSNSAELFDLNREVLKDSRLMICTGYALSDDGMWRQHSWLAWIKPRSVTLVETTVPRNAYFGFCMTTEQGIEFVNSNS